jgi:hypothetical protein
LCCSFDLSSMIHFAINALKGIEKIVCALIAQP